jgi:peptide/nickel transport system substrate-binding protein
MMMRRKLVTMALLCMMVIFAVEAASAKSLQIVNPFEIKTLDITKDNGYGRLGIVEKLFAVKKNGDVIGRLAKSWSVSEDKLTWTIELLPDIRFHDGSALTAEAAVKSLQYVYDHKGVLSKAPIKNISTAGPLTIKIETTKPFATLAAYLCHNSSGIVAPASFDSNGKMAKVIGTGFFSIEKLQGSNILKMSSFPEYWGAKPNIEQVVFNAVTKVETRAMMMEAGQAQLGYEFSPMAADRFSKDPNFQVHRVSMPRVRILKLNCGTAFFKDVRVRKAISLAINRKAIAKSILRNTSLAATQLLPPSFGGWFNLQLDPLVFDMAKAKELLSQAGWQPGPDGVLLKDGQPFEVTLFTYPARPMLPTIATAIQAQLKRVGIKVDIVVGKWTVIPQAHKDGTMQMSLFSRNFGLLPDAGGTIANDYSQGGDAWGSLGWNSPVFDQLVSDYSSSFDKQAAAKARKEITSILQNELPVIPIAWTQKVVVNHKSLTGVQEDMFELTYFLDQVKWAE